MRISFTPSMKSFHRAKSSMIPSADSSFGHSLSGTLNSMSSSKTNPFGNDLQVTRPWPHHERIPRLSHRPDTNHETHVQVSTKECPFCSFCSCIFVLILHIAKISVTSPPVINVPTRELLAEETKSSFVSCFQHLNNKNNVCKQISSLCMFILLLSFLFTSGEYNFQSPPHLCSGEI